MRDVNSSTGGTMRLALLTGGMDAPYALGLLSGIIGNSILVDVIGNDELKDKDVMKSNNIVYHNLRGDQNPQAQVIRKVLRVLIYYFRLIRYAARTNSKVFHILWLNKFTHFDRTLLNVYYKLLGKKLIYTAHNVNTSERDGTDSALNRFSLKLHYKLMDHVFVHTEKMKQQLIRDFNVNKEKVTVIPFGINNVTPKTSLTRVAAREKLSLQGEERVVLFFGNIAPYKGLDILIGAIAELKKKGSCPKLLIAGKVKDAKWMSYWEGIEKLIEEHNLAGDILLTIEYIADDEIEIYYKAADIVILPYRHIFQSGVLFLAYSFGLPVIVSDVGSLRDDVIEGQTGFVCPPDQAEALAKTISHYFQSNLFANLAVNRERIIEFATEKYSWQKIGDITCAVYSRLQSCSGAGPMRV
jgi:D-inositol-3-phosphate glycosyltransferase